MGNIKSMHTQLQWVSVDKHAIIVTIAMVPSVISTNMLRMHASDARNVTWCIEDSNSRGVNKDFIG